MPQKPAPFAAGRAARLLALFMCLVAVSHARPAASQNGKLRSELEGTWDGESMIRSDQNLKRTYKPGELWMTIVGDKMTSIGIISVVQTEVTVAINSATRPKQLDYPQRTDVTKKCIYTLEGDVLTLAVPRGEGLRPENMSPDRSTIITLRRRK